MKGRSTSLGFLTTGSVEASMLLSFGGVGVGFLFGGGEYSLGGCFWCRSGTTLFFEACSKLALAS